MRNRIILSLFLLFSIFMLGAGITMLHTYKTTANLESIINLHKIEITRQDLVINAQIVQNHLYALGTVFGKELDVIVDNVIELDDSVNNCLSCHHTPEMTAKLQDLVSEVDQYKDALSYLITTSANKERFRRLKIVTTTIGDSLLQKVSDMATMAGAKLDQKSINAIRGINNSKKILIITLVLSFFIALAISISMTRKIIEPIAELVDATRRIKGGELGYTTDYKGESEFGELISSFNDMSSSLHESNKLTIQHLHSLSNLYRISLRFHAITSETDIYRELSVGVSELVGAEQCGLMLLQGDDFLHMPHAVGLSEAGVNSLRAKKATMARLYSPKSKRAVLFSGDISSSPTFEADEKLGVRNLAFIWILRKSELIGAIRIANTKTGHFSEEDIRLLAILANNVSVALENARLYEDLRAQMQKLRDAQEQLVRAAKFAAIGELASNVAHEINNPLTSILGYAELIKEETDLERIMHDVEIIEKESLRAREIVNQLLEFSRKRALSVSDIDLPALLGEVMGLVTLQTKDTEIKIDMQAAQVPTIRGDANQLKQVLLNIINNAVFAMQEKGTLGIKVSSKAGYVNIRVSDTGRGIPKEVMSRLFEPFFTTKKEKGTGLGLSISYKIVQSHKGRIDVESFENEGTAFTVSLPMAGIKDTHFEIPSRP